MKKLDFCKDNKILKNIKKLYAIDLDLLKVYPPNAAPKPPLEITRMINETPIIAEINPIIKPVISFQLTFLVKPIIPNIIAEIDNSNELPRSGRISKLNIDK